MQPLVVSFWAGRMYQEEAALLELSCALWDCEHHIEQLPDTGMWLTNCNLKPAFLLRMLDEYDVPLLWLDADARVKGPLEGVMDTDGDVCIHRFRGREVCTGTILLRPSVGARELLLEWSAECAEFPHEWDQRNLANVLRRSSVKVGELGPAWCWIEGLSERYYRGVDPVVLQTQASRRLK